MLHCDHIEPLSFLVTKHNIKTIELSRDSKKRAALV